MFTYISRKKSIVNEIRIVKAIPAIPLTNQHKVQFVNNHYTMPIEHGRVVAVVLYQS